MLRRDVRSPEAALAFIIDCNLATVARLAGLKSRTKYEYERQISIAQSGVDWMVEMQVDFSTTQAQKVVDEGGSVESWAKSIEARLYQSRSSADAIIPKSTIR